MIVFLTQGCTKKNKSDEGHNLLYEAFRLEDELKLEQAQRLYKGIAAKYTKINLNEHDALEIDMYGYNSGNIKTYAEWAQYRLPFVECKINDMNKRSFKNKEELKSKIIDLITKNQTAELSQTLWCEVFIGPCQSEFGILTPDAATTYLIDEKTKQTHLLYNNEKNLVFSGFKEGFYSFRLSPIKDRWTLRDIVYCDPKFAKDNPEFQADKK